MTWRDGGKESSVVKAANALLDNEWTDSLVASPEIEGESMGGRAM